jgi:hypothetical protein
MLGAPCAGGRGASLFVGSAEGVEGVGGVGSGKFSSFMRGLEAA